MSWTKKLIDRQEHEAEISKFVQKHFCQ